jgi:hypothetical protein
MSSKVLRNLRRALSYKQHGELREKHLFPCMTAHFAEPIMIERGEMQVKSIYKNSRQAQLSTCTIIQAKSTLIFLPGSSPSPSATAILASTKF